MLVLKSIDYSKAIEYNQNLGDNYSNVWIELLEARLPVTWCRACSNAAHIRCMKVWAEHQETMARGDSNQAVQCPYCRQGMEIDWL